MIRRLRKSRSFWSALALGIMAVPAMLGGTAAAPAESLDQQPQPELNPLAVLPPNPADLLAGLLKAHVTRIEDLAPEPLRMLVAETAHRHGVDPRLIAAIVTVESEWNSAAIGGHGERGLMQILPSTGSWLAEVRGLKTYDLADSRTNLDLGATYLSILIKEYGTAEKALAVYNGGPRALAAWETNPYMRKVMGVYNRRPATPRIAPVPRERFGNTLARAS